MFNYFIPKLYLKSYKSLDIHKLEELGIKILVIDIDNTLVPFDVKKPDQEAYAFLNTCLNSKIIPVVISNNHEKRVREFLDGLNIKYYFESKKPLKIKYLRMQKELNVKANEVATIGDQLMTDVLGANRCGYYTILTKPLVNRDIFYTYPNRLLEKIIFYILKKCHKFDKGVYDEM